MTKKSLTIASSELSFETGKLAGQATASVVARYGDSVVLATVTVGREDKTKDYFPLSVEYQERLYAGGRIKGSRWLKRERNTDEETLSARLIDRSIRPLFPKEFKNEVQVIVMVLATDTIHDTDILAINAASAALAISPLPWAGPVGATRIGLENGQLVVNPQNGNREGVDLDLVVTCTDTVTPMIEAGANQIPEAQMMEAVKLAFENNQKIVASIQELVKEAGKEKIIIKTKVNTELVSQVQKTIGDKFNEVVEYSSKQEGGAALEALKTSVLEGFEPKDKLEVVGIIEELLGTFIRNNILKKSIRPDGRKLDEIRPLYCEVGVLPRVHGSAIFQRGQTQALTVTTLGAPSLGQSLESAEGESVKRYMHHYNFPPFSTGETGKVGSPKRREIGHGALAERGLAPVIPAESVFPYAIRVVSEIMSSNGSSSMASTCGSTLSLMDAGVPLIAPVAGISIGLVDDVLLTDIIGLEDHYGDMDFKVAGTETGITAIQLDTKVPGLTLAICEEVFARARTARMQIMEKMLATLPKYRDTLSQFAPKISTVQIPVEKIGELIGPGGKNIKKLMADNEVQIDVDDNGSVFVTGVDTDSTNKVLEYLKSMGREIAIGEIFEGVVMNLAAFGAFVNILPGKDGLVHVSRMSTEYVGDPATVVSVGQNVKVWVTEVTPEGKIGLSMLFDENGNPAEKAVEPRQDRPMGSRPYRPSDRSAANRGHDRFNAPRRRY
ncbi:polyribonucleotide nucleotidyltransferase [Candidatus Amesbacteria bacterium]|nr:polyribonucleotide nucleotidyltransferase [Candidatus Amesbacteria bacterium]